MVESTDLVVTTMLESIVVELNDVVWLSVVRSIFVVASYVVEFVVVVASVVVESTNEVTSSVGESTDMVSTLVESTDEVVAAVVKSICIVLSFVVVDSQEVVVSSFDVVSCCFVVSFKGDVVPLVVTFTTVIVSIDVIPSVDIIGTDTDSVITPEVNSVAYQENQFYMNR